MKTDRGVTPPSGKSRTVIDVTALISGLYTTVFIVTPPQHGVAVVVNGSSASTLRSATAPTTDGRRRRAPPPARLDHLPPPRPAMWGPTASPTPPRRSRRQHLEPAEGQHRHHHPVPGHHGGHRQHGDDQCRDHDRRHGQSTPAR
ncbi:hypothetical protein ACRAWD_31000 [Caulobacter segnis]